MINVSNPYNWDDPKKCTVPSEVSQGGLTTYNREILVHVYIYKYISIYIYINTYLYIYKYISIYI
jgi:hypothetical protein